MKNTSRKFNLRNQLWLEYSAAESSVNKHPYTGYTSKIKKAWLESTS